MKIVFGQLLDFSEILRGGSSFSHNFGNGTDIRVTQNVILVFAAQCYA